MAEIDFDGVTKVFGDGPPAVDRLSLHVNDGEFMVLVGPSGCGKTTALRMLAGLEEITSGTLKIGNAVVNNTLPKDRDVAMVFQNYALYPHMSVEKNIGFALKIRGDSKAEIKRKVDEAAAILRLEDYLDRRPKALSAVSASASPWVARLCAAPKPFSWTSPSPTWTRSCASRCAWRFARIQRLLNVATVYVTHDQVEAMTMGDRVAVMRDGKLQQVDTPQDLYDRPANEFVAGFMGSPPMNLLACEVRAGRERIEIVLGQQVVELPLELREHARPAGEREPGHLGRSTRRRRSSPTPRAQTRSRLASSAPRRSAQRSSFTSRMLRSWTSRSPPPNECDKTLAEARRARGEDGTAR